MHLDTSETLDPNLLGLLTRLNWPTWDLVSHHAVLGTQVPRLCEDLPRSFNNGGYISC